MISIRGAGLADAAALSLVGQAAFLDTYAEIVSGGDLVAHCARMHGVAIYEAWLADPGCALWLAETATGAPIGYCVMIPAILTHARSQPGDMEVLRIYVLSRFYGQGVGYRLMKAAVDEARAREARHVVLGMLKKNARALAFYERQGFVVAGTRSFQVGEMIMDDFVLVASL